jgi:hypothetical protein
VSEDYRVTVLKRFSFAVRAETPDEARALALVTATFDAASHVVARTRCLGRELTVESCEPAGGPSPGVPAL